MELDFVNPEESGWRHRGAPRRQVPPHIIETLRHAVDSGQVGVIDVKGDTSGEIAEALSALRVGARQLGRRIRIQQNPGQILFRMGDATS